MHELVNKVTTPTKFQLFKDDIEEYFDRYCYLGYLFEVQIKKMVESGFSQELRLRKHCHEFLRALIKEITNRTPDNIKILTHIETFSIDNALKHPKNNIVDILAFFRKDATQITNTEDQWNKLHLVNWANSKATVKFWIEVQNYKDAGGNIVLELSTFVISLLCLPYSNAEVERLFSQMNLI